MWCHLWMITLHIPPQNKNEFQKLKLVEKYEHVSTDISQSFQVTPLITSTFETIYSIRPQNSDVISVSSLFRDFVLRPRKTQI